MRNVKVAEPWRQTDCNRCEPCVTADGDVYHFKHARCLLRHTDSREMSWLDGFNRHCEVFTLQCGARIADRIQTHHTSDELIRSFATRLQSTLKLYSVNVNEAKGGGQESRHDAESVPMQGEGVNRK